MRERNGCKRGRAYGTRWLNHAVEDFAPSGSEAIAADVNRVQAIPVRSWFDERRAVAFGGTDNALVQLLRGALGLLQRES